ncbi:hypothetical protein [Saccharothrix xinjiangensis]|uniref:Uncharacterized protein n=1 Tax=Saccharothrix xinjiangensis TaxID=204798 RepID=A0ABV9XTB4_9PSEU
MTAPVLRANTELVAVAWLGGVPGLSPDIVGTTLPSEHSTWTATGFVTVRPTGGTSDQYVPLRSPVVTCEFWAVRPNSNRPPKHRANLLGEHVWAAVVPKGATERAAIKRRVELPHGYPPALVHSVHPMSELRPAYGEQGGLAHYLLDLRFHWTEES